VDPEKITWRESGNQTICGVNANGTPFGKTARALPAGQGNSQESSPRPSSAIEKKILLPSGDTATAGLLEYCRPSMGGAGRYGRRGASGGLATNTSARSGLLEYPTVTSAPSGAMAPKYAFSWTTEGSPPPAGTRQIAELPLTSQRT
jgi:hypothetical protein